MLREGEARGKRLAVYCLCDLYQPYQRQPRPVQCWVAHPTAHTCRSTAKPHESARCQRHVRCESELRGGAAPQSADVSRPFAWRHATPRGGARSWADAGSCVYLVAPDTPHAGLDAKHNPLSRSLSTNSRLPPTPKPRTATGLRHTGRSTLRRTVLPSSSHRMGHLQRNPCLHHNPPNNTSVTHSGCTRCAHAPVAQAISKFPRT